MPEEAPNPPLTEFEKRKMGLSHPPAKHTHVHYSEDGKATLCGKPIISDSPAWATFQSRDLTTCERCLVELDRPTALTQAEEDAEQERVQRERAHELVDDLLRYRPEILERFVLASRIMLSRAKQYNDEEAYSNLKSSERRGIPAWVGTINRAGDKWSRLEKLAKDGLRARYDGLQVAAYPDEHREDPASDFGDLAIYCLIAWVLYDEANASSDSLT